MKPTQIIKFGKKDIAIFAIPGKLSKETSSQLMANLESRFGTGQVLILEEGATLESVITRKWF
ncbi:MAG: hypothetical protein M0R74_03330 [Dehalococcoidia bacterium]|jgi:hypothetical protein|nr:hypothetical protein [Dehalococcoidia bacterium]